MFQLNLLIKKIKNFFTIFKKDNLEYLLINNFRQIFIFFALLGVIVVMISFAFITCNKKKKSILDTQNLIQNDSTTVKNKDSLIILNDNQREQLHLLLDSEFSYPSIKSFDISTDYIEFKNMLKNSVIPEINFEDFSDYFKQIEDESLLFNIEKRKR